MSHLILALVLASAAWLVRGAFLDRDEAGVEQLLAELEPPSEEGDSDSSTGSTPAS